MKSKFLQLGILASSTLIAGTASAQLLFSDNFDTVGSFGGQLPSADFNDLASLTADQAGTLATKDYNLSLGGGWGGALQRGNAGTWLMYAGAEGFGSNNMHGSVNHNFATEANTLGLPLQVGFNMSVTNATGAMSGEPPVFIPDTTQWSAFAMGGSQNQFVNNAANNFSSLFRDNGATQQFGASVEIGSSATFTDGQLITFVFSDAAETGSAFNSDGPTDVVKMYVNGSLTNTFTGLNFGPSDGFISFQANSTNANIDNLTVTALSGVSDPYLTWIDTPAFGLGPAQKAPAGDPDNDGIANIVEYVLQGGDPSVSTTSILPTLNASGTDFVFSFFSRTAATGTTQTFQYGDNLVGWTNVPIVNGGQVAITTSAGIDSVVVTVPKGSNTKLFGRLQVVKNP